MMPFIGARSKTWQHMLQFNGSLSGMVEHYRRLINITGGEHWDTDQVMEEQFTFPFPFHSYFIFQPFHSVMEGVISNHPTLG